MPDFNINSYKTGGDKIGTPDLTRFRSAFILCYAMFFSLWLFYSGLFPATALAVGSDKKISLLETGELSRFPEIKKMIDDWRYSDAFSVITEKLNMKEPLNARDKLSLYISLSVVLKMLARPADALVNINQAAAIDASSEICLYYLSLLSLSTSDIRKADLYASELKTLYPRNPWGYLISSTIYAYEGRAAKAYEEINKTLKYEQNLFEARAFLFSYYKKRKKYDAARNELKKLMKLTPNFELAPFFNAAGFNDRKNADDVVKSELFYEYGNLMYNYFKNPKSALKYYRQSEKLNASHVKTKIGMAQYYALFNQNDRAAELLTEAFRLNPDERAAAEFYNKFDNAESIETFINLNINTMKHSFISTRFSFCQACGTANKLNARKCVNCKKNIIHRSAVKDIPAVKAVSSIKSPAADKKLKNIEDEEFSGSDEIERKYDECLETGIKNLENKDYESAENNFKEMILLMPDSPEGYNLLGATYLATHNYNVAIDNFKRAISLNADFAEGYFSLGKTYELTGKNLKAIEMYKKAVKIDSEYEEAAEALKEISKIKNNNKNKTK